MAERNLELTPRKEDTRDKIPVVVKRFELAEIKSRFDSTISEIESQFTLSNSLPDDAMKNIFRSQIVFLESALDFYLHELSKYGFASIFSGSWEKTEKYNNFQISMRNLEEGLKNPESSTWLSEYTNERFSREVYLSYESMKDQLNMLGLNFESIITSAFPKPADPKLEYRDGKEIIRDLFKRRNQIAHQFDRVHATAEKVDITREYVEQCISDVKCLVNIIHTVAKNKENV